MMRQKASESEFCTQLGKMVVKKKYDEGNTGDLENANNEPGESDDNSLTEAEQLVIAESGLTYDKESKVIDMSKFKATNYKFNKFVHLPEAGNMLSEAKHEIRKSVMLKVFLNSCRQYEGRRETDVSSADTCGQRQVSSESTAAVDNNG